MSSILSLFVRLINSHLTDQYPISTRTENIKILPVKMLFVLVPFLCVLFHSVVTHVYQNTEEITSFHIGRPIKLINPRTDLYFPHIDGEIPKDTFVNLPNTTHIKIRGNIVYIEPEAFNDLTNLEGLDVSWNKIAYLVNGTFAGLTQLTTLILEGNIINYIEPDAFADLENLVYLNLDYNRNLKILRDFAFSGLNGLTNLDVNYCGLKKLEPNAFEDVQNLQNLSMNHNELPGVDTRIFASCPNLKSLTVRHNKIDRIDSDMLRILIVRKLKLFDISNNPYACETKRSKSKMPKVQDISIVIIDECDKESNNV